MILKQPIFVKRVCGDDGGWGMKEEKTAPRALYVVTLFVSAGLLFAVQPMLGKMMLPLVGGSPSGWLTALAFFQLALLAGYLLAHGLSRLSARGQAWATVGVLALGFIQLPPGFGGSSGVENVDSAWGVVELLLRAIFVPYLGLATVSSGLQRLYAARAGAGSDPYFLYAASNAGSFVGLLAYPLVVEPLVPLSVQSVGWLVGYGLLVALIVALAWPKGGAAVAATATPTPTAAKPPPPLTWRQRGQWVLLAFIPSSLSMGLTSLVTADFGSLPLFWVIPLALYLLTFVLAFAPKVYVSDNRLNLARLLIIVPLMLIYMRGQGLLILHWWLVPVPILAFFFTAWWCHQKLSSLRPNAGLLTEFYLWLSFGGALGGVFNAFLAPYIFTYAAEYFIVLLLSLWLSPQPRAPRIMVENQPVFGILMLLMIGMFFMIAWSIGPDAMLTWVMTLPLALGLLAIALLPRVLMILGIIVCIAVSPLLIGVGRIDMARNFFGTYFVSDTTAVNGKTMRRLYHGALVEGMQTIAPVPVAAANVYFSAPLTELFRRYNFRDIGMLGLGAGIGLCFNDGTRNFTVYEINPLMRDLARKHFTYISSCGEPRWRIGDARKMLEKDEPSQYDFLILDAFTSASIPSHLITREAVALYISRLRPDGMMVWNTNSVYYELAPVLAAMAHEQGWQAWKHYDEVGDFANDITPNHWVLLAPKHVDLTPLLEFAWEEIPKSDFPIWRDDFANILAALRMTNHAQTSRR